MLTLFHRDGHREVGDALQKIQRAIQRIDDPCVFMPGVSVVGLFGDDFAVMSFAGEGLADVTNNPTSEFFTVTYVTTTTTSTTSSTTSTSTTTA